MRIKGLFLNSRVARRTFRILIAAALLPLALFALLGSQAFLADRAERQRHAETEFLKHIGMRTFDRLTAAKATLAAHAAEGNFMAPNVQDAAVRAVLRAVATVDRAGEVQGDAALAQAWRQAMRDQAPTPLSAPRELWWQPAGADDEARVMFVLPDEQGRGRWVAEINPGFVWQDFAADGPAANLCMTDAQRQRLRCPQPAAADDPSWRLFLTGSFGSGEWMLLGQPVEPKTALQDHVLRLVALGGAATMVLIVILGLVLVRRTMVPLEQLIAGTRKVSAGDWSARVAVGRNDEFGQLARLFNSMVERLGRQAQAVGVQAEIDRELLGSLDVARVMQQVLARLQVLLPRARLAVVVRSGPGLPGQVHRAGQAVVTQMVPEADWQQPAHDGLTVQSDVPRLPPPWVQHALALPAGHAPVTGWMPASWQDVTVALLLWATPEPLTLDDDARREVEALRDRCALAIAAAEREHRLVERAVRDELTGLLNRHGLHDACDVLLAAPASSAAVTLLYVDLDGFKEINDSMGHTAGDTLLREVAERMRIRLPRNGWLARPGGDEFVAVLPGISDAEAEALADDFCESLARPFVVRGQLQHIGASIGLASSPADGTDRDELLRRADLAMYAAKAGGRGRWCRYAPTLDQAASERAWVLRDLRSALEHGGLEVHFQPRLDVRSGRTCSAEALVRWRHPERGWIPPMRFVPVAEESDLILTLGQQVLDLALAQRRRWYDLGLDVGRVAVNVSARQLRAPRFADLVLARLAHHRLRPQDLELEITESLFAGELTMVQRALAPLRLAGVLVALDDFGTGYSSLSALRHLPVDVMKIDRTFVIDLGQDRDCDAVVRSVIALARDLGKRVVAEGVETEQQQQRLLALGCDEVQGYRYARPLTADVFIDGARVGFDAPIRTTEDAAETV